jgi:hypothetical protein
MLLLNHELEGDYQQFYNATNISHKELYLRNSKNYIS